LFISAIANAVFDFDFKHTDCIYKVG
jgi:hypothetical protein